MNTFFRITGVLLALATGTTSILAVEGRSNPFGVTLKSNKNRNSQQTIFSNFLDGDAALKTLKDILDNFTTGENGQVRIDHAQVIANLTNLHMGALGLAFNDWRMAMINRLRNTEGDRQTAANNVATAIQAVRNATNDAFNNTAAGQALNTYLIELERVVGIFNQAVVRLVQPVQLPAVIVNMIEAPVIYVRNSAVAQSTANSTNMDRLLDELLNGRGDARKLEEVVAFATQGQQPQAIEATPEANENGEKTKAEQPIDYDTHPEAYHAAAADQTGQPVVTDDGNWEDYEGEDLPVSKLKFPEDENPVVVLTVEDLNNALAGDDDDQNQPTFDDCWLAALQLVGAYPGTYGLMITPEGLVNMGGGELNRRLVRQLHNDAMPLTEATDTNDLTAVRDALNEITLDNGAAYDAYIAAQARIETNAAQIALDTELARRLESEEEETTAPIAPQQLHQAPFVPVQPAPQPDIVVQVPAQRPAVVIPEPTARSALQVPAAAQQQIQGSRSCGTKTAIAAAIVAALSAASYAFANGAM